jgi:hypothetical protein
MRDDFPIVVKDVLAKRVGLRCSNPDCRQLTSGPQVDPTKATNIGVAAHITAASPDGPRYEPSLTADERRSADNGIWLCQNHGKLVDNDHVRYSVMLLREWKRIAESMAQLELQNPRQAFDDEQNAVFAKAEQLMPELLSEMRHDLETHPVRREFVLLRKGWSYWAKGNELVYFFEDHPDLLSKLQVLENLDCVREITYNNVKRFIMTESFVEFLVATTPPQPSEQVNADLPA